MANVFSSITGPDSGILKQFYSGAIVSQFNDDNRFYKNVEKLDVPFSGSTVQVPVNVLRNPGYGSGSDGGPLPVIGTQTTVQAAITAKYQWLRFGLTSGMMKATKSDVGSFAREIGFQLKRGMADLTASNNRQLFFDGSGKIATVAANVVASTVVTVTGRTTNEAGNKYIFPNMVIDIYTSAGVQVASGITVTAVSGSTTATLTLSSAVTTSATDIVVISNSFNKEVSGLRYTLDGLTTATYGINRATYQNWQANVLNASGGQLTLDLMQSAFNAGQERGGADFDVIYTDYTTDRYINKLLVADKRFIGNKVVGDGSFSDNQKSYLEFGGLKVIADKDCTTDVYFLSSKNWKKFVLSELEVASESGAELIPQPGVDAWEVRIRLFYDFFCEKPIAQSRLSNYISP